jgi:hypothetical protein
VLEMFEPEIASLRATAAQITSALGPRLNEAKSFFAQTDRDTQVVAGLAAGLVLGRAVRRLGL